MKITLDITNQKTAEQILWMLDHFKKDGVKIHKINVKASNSTTNNSDNVVSDNDIKANWKALLLQAESDPEYYKSERFKSDKADFLMEKYK